MYNAQGGYNQYLQQQKMAIQTADRVTLIRMLLEGAISFNKKVEFALESNDSKAALEYIDRAARIVMHLYSCLNFEDGGEVADRLGRLYNYVCDQYIVFQKNMDNKDPLNSINSVLSTLLEGWKQLPNAES